MEVGAVVVPVAFCGFVSAWEIEQGSVVDHDPWFLLREIVCSPELSFFREKKAPNEGSNYFVTGRNLLQIGVSHRQPPSNRTTIVGAQLVDVRVYPSILF
jgi:hypothetical protein